MPSITGHRRSRIRLVLTVGIVCTLLASASPPSVAQATPPPLPPRPVPPSPLPPRPTPAARARQAVGGRIQLCVQFTGEWQWIVVHWHELWTVVQWQDRSGRWRDVAGWQGTLDGLDGGEGRKEWWVAEDDLGKGPFRWAVYRRRGSWLVGRSEPFDLPGPAGRTEGVEVLPGRW